MTQSRKKKATSTHPMLDESSLAAVKKPPKELTPNQRRPTDAETTIRRGDIVSFFVGVAIHLEQQIGVVVRTPTDPGGMTGLYDIVPIPGSFQDSLRHLPTLFDASFGAALVMNNMITPPVPILIPRGDITGVFAIPDSLSAADYMTETNKMRENRVGPIGKVR
jgi:hypothetical protein